MEVIRSQFFTEHLLKERTDYKSARAKLQIRTIKNADKNKNY